MTEPHQPSGRRKETAHRYFIGLIRLLERLNALRPLAAVRLTFAAAMPLVMLGSFASLLLNFPVPALHTWLDSYIGQSWRTMCAHIITGTFGIVSLVVLCAVSGSLAKGSHARGIPAGMLTIAAFALLNILLDGIGVTNIHQTVSTIFTVPLSGLHDGLVLALGYTELSQTIWFFGVHGLFRASADRAALCPCAWPF